MIKTKKCSKCHETQPISRFTKKSSKKSGLKSWCKSCSTRPGTLRRGSRKWKEMISKLKRNTIMATKVYVERKRFTEHLDVDDLDNIPGLDILEDNNNNNNKEK